MDVYGYPIGIFEPFTQEQVSKIREEIQAYFHSDENPILESVKWNANCLTSSPDGHGREDMPRHQAYHGYTPLIETVCKCFREYLSNLGLEELQPSMYRCGKQECDECVRDVWFNVYRKGHSQEPHWHHGDDTGCAFGFVYFAQYDPEKDGKFIFLNPAPDLKIPGLEKCPAFEREFAPDVKEGTLMFFPAFMVHRVSEQLRDEERITFTGNFFVCSK